MDRAIAALARVTDDLMIAADEARAFSGVAKVRVVRDIVPDMGPLGGIVSAFANTPRVRLLVLGCDTLASDAAIDALIEAAPAPAVIAAAGGRPQYLCAIYSRELLPRFELGLARGELSMAAALGTVRGALYAPVPDASLANINTAKDLARAEDHAAI